MQKCKFFHIVARKRVVLWHSNFIIFIFLIYIDQNLGYFSSNLKNNNFILAKDHPTIYSKIPTCNSGPPRVRNMSVLFSFFN